MFHQRQKSSRSLCSAAAMTAISVSAASACQIHLDPAAGLRAANAPAAPIAAPAFATSPPGAVLVPANLNVFGQRPLMAGEGLLEGKVNPFAVGGARFGHEFSGWVDVRHPALSGGTSTLFGFDRYDRQIGQATTILTDRNGVIANSDIPRDLNHANRAFASQAGVSILERSTRGYTLPLIAL